MRIEDGTKRVLLSLHPAIVTVVFLALYIVGFVSAVLIAKSQAGLALALLVSLAFLIAWIWSLWAIADQRLSAPPNLIRRSTRKRLYLLGAILALQAWLICVPQLYQTAPNARNVIETVTFVLMLAFVVSYLIFIWSASSALLRFELGAIEFPWHLNIGTSILLFYLPIGVWFMSSRVRRLLSAS